jgi:hypothetical protein
MDMTNEEDFKVQLEEDMGRFEEAGYFKRLGKMFSGLGRPRDSREYKEALIEVQRQIAPLLAVLLPLICVVVLFVVTAMDTGAKKEIKVEIVTAEDETKVDEEPPPPDVEPPPEPDVEVQVDTPTVGSTTEAAEVTPPTAEPQSAKVSNVDAMLNIKSPVMMANVFGDSRNSGRRGTALRGGNTYGDPTTEAAVMKALRWLKWKQNSDGSWPGVKPASTAFAILTYLAHGETPTSKEFGPTVRLALEFLTKAIHERGGKTMIAGTDGNEYSFLIAAYALCEAYGMTKNPDLREPAERCLTRIIAGQNATGGWNYKLARSTRDDISYGGWAMQALKAGKMAGIHPSGLDECIKKAIKCLKTRNYNKKAGFVYTPGARGGGLGGVGCLCLQLLGQSKDTTVANALDVMRDWSPTFEKKHMSGGSCSQYYSYYAAQCKYQAGMVKGATPANLSLWKKWNVAMKELYPKRIINDKKADGSPVTIKDAKGKDRPVGHWENTDVHTTRPVMDTCLTALQLMVYYRYLPTTSLKAAEVEEDVGVLSKDKGNEVKVQIDI